MFHENAVSYPNPGLATAFSNYFCLAPARNSLFVSQHHPQERKFFQCTWGAGTRQLKSPSPTGTHNLHVHQTLKLNGTPEPFWKLILRAGSNGDAWSS